MIESEGGLIIFGILIFSLVAYKNDAQVGEWGGGDCGPVLVRGEGGTLTVVTLLRQ